MSQRLVSLDNISHLGKCGKSSTQKVPLKGDMVIVPWRVILMKYMILVLDPTPFHPKNLQWQLKV